MTTIDMTHGNAARGFGGFVARIQALFAAWNDARITRRELDRLSERELNDIGLCRADIDHIARMG
ncbi:DUF1127 domain-containing protein [Paracoccus sp. (in: a-proteobacteria)]|uniref:DUF1127 domain-containing protein n=1 Tax=Paracoccus sp. TaxID=267 RepID=UPI0026E0ABBE|nr:DUF1127 domain-containing protein [Paracoccus sp. (in: a-proteobacteria)]MDO5647336.1 DUF1127 domain-containing protein [Paracoccus sp. (in: a-proteobacteria)]